jgi:hypothetical protein
MQVFTCKYNMQEFTCIIFFWSNGHNSTEKLPARAKQGVLPADNGCIGNGQFKATTEV